MNSDSKSFLFAFLFFIAFGLVELINQGVFIFPIFLVAPFGFGVLGYVLIKAKERVSVFNMMALLSMLLITLISGFIPMLTTQVPAYLQNETFVSSVAIGIGVCWVVAYLFFSISAYQKNNNNIIYILLLLLSFAGWIFFDWKGSIVMQGILIFVSGITIIKS